MVVVGLALAGAVLFVAHSVRRAVRFAMLGRLGSDPFELKGEVKLDVEGNGGATPAAGGVLARPGAGSDAPTSRGTLSSVPARPTSAREPQLARGCNFCRKVRHALRGDWAP